MMGAGSDAEAVGRLQGGDRKQLAGLHHQGGKELRKKEEEVEGRNSKRNSTIFLSVELIDCSGVIWTRFRARRSVEVDTET